MKLIFKNGNFLLGSSGGKTEFVDFKQATKYREYADEQARKVLDQAFIKRYTFHGSLPGFLDEHQKEGVKWILTRSRSYLAHAPGAGKTAQAITAALLSPGDGQIIFIVPPSLTMNWAREIEKFHPLLQPPGKFISVPSYCVLPKSGKQSSMDWDAQMLIIADSMLTKSWVLEGLALTTKKFIAVDEASRFKEVSAQRTLALFGGRNQKNRTVPGIIQGAKYVVLMDGSPMPNRSMELWAPTFAMSPESIDFMSQNDFGFRYCGAQMNAHNQWEFKRDSNSEELKSKLQESFMHVVPESRLNHPERLRSILFMDKDARSLLHKNWEKKYLSTFQLSDIGENASQGALAKFRRELGLRKIDWVADYVSERLTTKNESIILFAWHREVCLGLEEKLAKFNPGLVIGGTDSLYREKKFEQFQAGKIKLLIMNIAAGGRGHNLQKADRVVFAEYSWTDETNKQCEARAARKGRDVHLPVRADYIVSPNSMDEMILQAVMRKEVRVKRVIG